MEREDIENVIREIMFHDGPDRHTDGSDVITDFVLAVLEDRAEAWTAKYAARHRSNLRFIAA